MDFDNDYYGNIIHLFFANASYLGNKLVNCQNDIEYLKVMDFDFDFNC